LRRDSGDDIRGDFISYDARAERFTVKSAGEPGTNREGRVRATIMPKKPAPSGPTAPDAGQRN
jgi:lipopolysaccharide export system protein LptA